MGKNLWLRSYQSPEVKAYITDEFKGTVIPSW